MAIGTGLRAIKPFASFQIKIRPYRSHIDHEFCMVIRHWFEGHKTITSAKVQRSETFADVGSFKLKYGLTNNKDWV